jgi:hypothetical protein
MRLRVVDTRDEAEKTFQIFHDRSAKKKTPLPFSWPTKMQEIGEGKAEIYRSNKWKTDLREFEDYKHVVEGWRTAHATVGFLRDDRNSRNPIAVAGPMVKFESPMPEHVTVLGQLLGVQLRLYRRNPKGGIYLPKGDMEEGGLYEVRVAHAHLAAAEHPESGEIFLCVYDARGVHMILTGSIEIEKDGIAG